MVYSPDEEPLDPALNEQTAGQNNPVHQPWCKLSRIGSLEGFVGGEQGEEERGDGAVDAGISNVRVAVSSIAL